MGIKSESSKQLFTVAKAAQKTPRMVNALQDGLKQQSTKESKRKRRKKR